MTAVEAGGGPREGLFDELVFKGSADSAVVAAHFLGRTVTATHRHGKQLWLTLSGEGLQPAFHFGMSGSFAVKGEAPASYVRYKADAAHWPPKYSKLLLTAGDGTEVAFVNSRRFGRVRFFDDPSAHPPIAGLGFDPLLSLPPRPAFTAALRARRQAVKAVLLDQAFSAGVGNWIADEVVYQARVHPSHPAHLLTDSEAGAVHAALRDVVATAVAGCAGDRDEALPADWLFHFRWTKKATNATDAGGRRIQYLTVGGRTTAYVPDVQGGAVWKGRAAAGAGRGGAAAAAAVPVKTVSEAPSPAAARGVKRRRAPVAAAKMEAAAAQASRKARRKATDTSAPRAGSSGGTARALRRSARHK